MGDITRDTKAGYKEFLEIFGAEKKKLDTETKKTFLKNFKGAYDAERKYIEAQVGSMPSNTSQKHIFAYCDIIKHGLNNALIAIPKAKNIRPVDEAKVLGYVLGNILAVIDFGIANTLPQVVWMYPDNNPKININGKNVDRILGIMMNELVVIKNEMYGLNKDISLKFLKNRVAQIAREKAGKLSPNQELVLAKIANLFR